MTEAIMHTEIQRKISNDMNQNDLSESAQQMGELQTLLSSQPSDSSSDYLQQQQQLEDEVTINLKEIIKDCGDGLLSPECCIYRVPITLRHLKDEVYTPKVVSIGPFHYGNKRLQDMERHKHILFKRFTRRTTSSFNDLVHLIKRLLPKVRASYSEPIKLNEQKLVELTLIDAGFIIEFILSMISTENWQRCEDAKLSQSWLVDSIYYDLLLLENQLPFFVIEKLFNKAFPHYHHGGLPSFLDLTYNYFSGFNVKMLKPNHDVKIKHFTDLLRLFHLPTTIPEGRTLYKSSQILLYNANALQEAGIKFKVGKGKCPLDLKFSGHQLEIPQIFMNYRTELCFGNMIALEQCHYPHHTYITDYIVMLDCLVDTNKDVDILVHNEIVTNGLGDTNNVSLLFNGLVINAVQENFNSEYWDICKSLNEHCRDRWHKMKATLRRDYYRTPWQIVASIAAIVLLLLLFKPYSLSSK